mmetsp:Transcript_29018/g.45517  ORF Transcript_29018/g.45517 Transcript_29018/m.45517 type:complete len:204 (-) Transcript_29018:1302-1913(-)
MVQWMGTSTANAKYQVDALMEMKAYKSDLLQSRHLDFGAIEIQDVKIRQHQKELEKVLIFREIEPGIHLEIPEGSMGAVIAAYWGRRGHKVHTLMDARDLIAQYQNRRGLRGLHVIERTFTGQDWLPDQLLTLAYFHRKPQWCKSDLGLVFEPTITKPEAPSEDEEETMSGPPHRDWNHEEVRLQGTFWRMGIDRGPVFPMQL